MSKIKRSPVLGIHVRDEVARGATISYEPFFSEKGRIEWMVHIVFPDGHREPVLVSKTARPKCLKTADAVVSYNRDLFPGSDGVFIPYPPASEEE